MNNNSNDDGDHGDDDNRTRLMVKSQTWNKFICPHASDLYFAIRFFCCLCYYCYCCCYYLFIY